jgi:hypothetical protein
MITATLVNIDGTRRSRLRPIMELRNDGAVAIAI